MTIARVDGNAVVELRELSISDVPEHKRALWRPVVIEGDGSIENRIVEADRVRLVRTYPADIKEQIKAQIDSAAETARSKYITQGAGQALTYDRKRREALQAIDDPAPTAEKYPVLSASIGIEVANTGNLKTDFDAISTMVIAKERQWALVANAIEVLRLGAKKAVDEAASVAEAQAAAQVAWPRG